MGCIVRFGSFDDDEISNKVYQDSRQGQQKGIPVEHDTNILFIVIKFMLITFFCLIDWLVNRLCSRPLLSLKLPYSLCQCFQLRSFIAFSNGTTFNIMKIKLRYGLDLQNETQEPNCQPEQHFSTVKNLEQYCLYPTHKFLCHT